MDAYGKLANVMAVAGTKDDLTSFLGHALRQESLPDFEMTLEEALELDQIKLDALNDNWYDEFKRAEQDYMVAMDDYAELAQALGIKCDSWYSWFGDPSHKEVVERAKELAEKAWRYDEVSK